MSDTPPPAPLPLPLARYRLAFAAEDELNLPAYSGSAWRGAFGTALKRLVCVTRSTTCPPCPLYRACTYPYLFETPPDPDAGRLRKYPAAPHPYVLRPAPDNAGHKSRGERLELELTLFGAANRYLPYVVRALEQAAERGLGAGRGRARLDAVEQATATGWSPILAPTRTVQPLPPAVPELPPVPARVHLALDTPLRLVVDERNVAPGRFRFAHLFASLLRRVSSLAAFHADGAPECDYAALRAASDAVEWRAARFRWHDWARFSSRQDRLVQMGGLVGEAELDGEAVAAFWPWLWLGQHTHAGKGTVMGLGRYRLAGV